MTLKRLNFKPTLEFKAACEACCKNFIVESKPAVKLLMAIMHVIPFACMAAEFWYSSVRFYLRQYWVFNLLSIGYIGVNLLQSFFSKDSRTLYPCLDWHRRPDIAAVVAIVLLIVQFGVFALLRWLSNQKIKNNFVFVT